MNRTLFSAFLFLSLVVGGLQAHAFTVYYCWDCTSTPGTCKFYPAGQDGGACEPGDSAGPTVSLTANPTTVNSGQTTSLTWSSSNASGCYATGPWTNSPAGAGSGPSYALTQNSTLTFTCSDPNGPDQSPPSEGKSVNYLCGDPNTCPLASTIFLNGALNKSIYKPGEAIYMNATVSSDDNPQPTGGVTPIARGTVPGQSQSADLFPNTYTPQQIRSTQFSGNVLIGTAPTTVGNYAVSTSYSSGGYNTQTGSLPFTVANYASTEASVSVNVTVNAGANNATCTSMSAPSSVVAGSSFLASVSMTNTGGTTWTSAANYNLGSQSPQDNTTWGTNRVALPSNIAPGGMANFTGYLPAPSTPGTYTFAWKMVQDGVEWFGGTCSQQIIVTTSLPTVTTSSASNISASSATSGGTISSNGGATVTVSGIVWSTSANPTTSSYLGKTTDGWAIGGPWSDAIGGLAAGTTYHVRAYATNSAGTAYGNDVSFTTSSAATCTAQTINNCTLPATSSGGSANGACVSGYTGSCNYTCSSGTWTQNTNTCTPAAGVPSVTTSSITSISDTGATSGGTIVSNGGSTVTVSGIVWSTSSNPTTASNLGKTTDGWASGGPWSDAVTGLTAGTTYHVRAYATNAAGTAYGSDVAFTTTDSSSGTATGTISAPNCTIATGASTCSTTVTWSTDASVTSAQVFQDGSSISTALSGSKARTVGNTTSTFELYDRSPSPDVLLDSDNARGNCAAGSGWNGTICEAGYMPDLTAGAITPSSAQAGSSVTLQATITNIGPLSTARSFNNFIQVANQDAGGGTITDLREVSMNTLAAGASNTTSKSYTFPSAGTYSARACADKRNRNDSGQIDEASEGNNCTNPWTTIVVAGAPAPSVTASLSASPTSINPGSTSRLTWSSTNATSCQFADKGTADGTSGSRTVSPSVTSTYSVTCTGAGGDSPPALATVTVNTPVLSMTATPARVKKGSTSTVAWNATSVKSCTITKNGAAWKSGAANGSNVYTGSSLETISAQTTYVMTCKDVSGANYPTPEILVVNIAPAFQEF
jgi:hypothetical protein